MKPRGLEPLLSQVRSPTANLEDRPLGRILMDMGKLRVRDIDRIFTLHRERGLRFGEAARKLKLVTDADVQQALAIQFNYPYLKPGQGTLSDELVAAHEPFDPQTEMLRELRTRLLLEFFSGEPRVLAIISADPRDGRSYLAANLAVAFAQLGEKTLLVDADLRFPRQHRIFGQTHGSGLAQALAGRGGLDGAERVPYFESLWLLAAGAAPPNPLELLSRATFAGLLAEARRSFHIVIVDTPAAARGADGRLTASRADGVLLVARPNRTRLADLERICGAALAGSTRLAGAVLNNV